MQTIQFSTVGWSIRTPMLHNGAVQMVETFEVELPEWANTSETVDAAPVRECPLCEQLVYNYGGGAERAHLTGFHNAVPLERLGFWNDSYHYGLGDVVLVALPTAAALGSMFHSPSGEIWELW